MKEFEVRFDIKFLNSFKKLDKNYQERTQKLINKIILNPRIGKPMKNVRKGTRELYLKPFRISYELNEQKLIIIFLEIYYKNKQ